MAKCCPVIRQFFYIYKVKVNDDSEILSPMDCSSESSNDHDGWLREKYGENMVIMLASIEPTMIGTLEYVSAYCAQPNSLDGYLSTLLFPHLPLSTPLLHATDGYIDALTCPKIVLN